MPIYRDIYDGPPRSYGGKTPKKWIVIHCTSNTASAVNEAAYAKWRTDNVSSHYYVDGKDIVQSLDTDLRAHHVGSTIGNNGGIAYEITGLVSWPRSKWLSSVAWHLLGPAIARDCAHHEIPVRLLSVRDIKAGRGGIITHNQARIAWGGTDHTDPGPNFPLDHLIKIIKDGDEMPTADEIAKAVYDRLSWTVKQGQFSDTSGAFPPGHVIRPDKALELAWAYGKHNYRSHRELRAGQEAILAALAGKDVVAAVQTELDRHYHRLVTELAPDLAAEVREHLTEVPPDEVETVVIRAVEKVASKLRIVVDTMDGDE